MSSAGVDGFLAAKWKSKNYPSEDGSTERGEEKIQEKSAANSKTPGKSPETHQNTPQKEIGHTAATRKFEQTVSKTAKESNQEIKMQTMEDAGSSTSTTKANKRDFTSGRVNGEYDTNSDTSREDGDVSNEDIFSDSDDEGASANTKKEDKYEMGDVWGLLDQQNDDSGQEEDPKKDSKPTGTTKNSDVNRTSREGSGKGQATNESDTGVPKMAIPFSNFSKLLEHHGNAVPTMQNHSLSTTADTPPSAPASLNRPTAQNKSSNGMEPDSTTKSRLTPPNSGETLPKNPELGTQKAIIETNLHQRLLPQHKQKRPEFANITLPELTVRYDPLLGPSDSDPVSVTGITPISRFKQNIDPLAKTVAYNVLKYFENRKRKFNLTNDPLRIASDATGMPKSTMRKIEAEAEEQQLEERSFPESRGRKLPKRKFSELNVKRDCIVRMFIHNSYLIKKEVPTLKKIIENCQKSGFEKILGSTTTCVKAQLKKLGFEYTARSGNTKFLIERPDFIAQRIRYLEEMQEHREQGRNIVFVFIADMLRKGVKEVEWEGWDGVFEAAEQGIDIGCVSVLHAATENMVFHEVLQVMEYEVNSNVDLPRKPFIHWLTNKVLPQVRTGSVIVLGDRRFNETVEVKERPHIGCTKEQIVRWLRQHNVASSESWPKALLLERVQKVVLEQKYTIDDMIAAKGFIPVHLPLHHRDLNPLSFLWQDIKDKIDANQDTQRLRSLRVFIKDEFAKAAVKLAKAAVQVEKLEKSYYNIDMHTDEEKQELILDHGDGLVPINRNNEREDQSSDDDEYDPPDKRARTG